MLLSIQSLCLKRGGTQVLHGVDLTLGEGEIYGLLGPNGAGKSTTIATTLGLLCPESGTVRVFGQDPRVASQSVWSALGVLPERCGFYDWMSAEAYLGFFAKLYGRESTPDAMRKHMDLVGLVSRPGQLIGAFSRGMRQRLALARALLPDPKLLVLDEPTNGLDPRGRREMHDLFLQLAHRGIGILLCTHLLDDVDRLCSRVGVIVEGRTVVEGMLSDLLQEHQRNARYRIRLETDIPPGASAPTLSSIVAREADWCVVDIATNGSPAEAWRELLSLGWPVVEIREEGSGLEALYLALTTPTGRPA
ncbi:hypothetical protein JCM15519_21730 [Fundidesulfovibrio butyratiphilus]